MALSRSYHRTRLLQLASEKEFSDDAIREIMLLFGNLAPEQKEDAAKNLYPIIENCGTDEEALESVVQVIQQILGK